MMFYVLLCDKLTTAPIVRGDADTPMMMMMITTRSMTIFAEANVDVDLRMLRSFRVLRPLKLVSRIPSKTIERILIC